MEVWVQPCSLIVLSLILSTFRFGFLAVKALEPYESKESCTCGNANSINDKSGTLFSAYGGIPIEKLDQPLSKKSTRCTNVTVSETDIARDIFRRHYSWERPLIDARKPIDIEIRLVLQAINDIVEKDKILKLTGYLLIYWWDEYHVWNTTFPHACLDSVVMHHDEVWIPELVVTNSHQHYELMLMYDQERVRMYSSGWASYKPGGTFGVFCDFDLTYFPFDQQTCTVNLESWRYTYDYQIFHFGDTIQLRYWIENEQWMLLNTSQRLGTVRYVTANLYASVQFTLVLKRKVGYYLVNVIIPSIIISVAEIATFTLPVDEVMKVHISFTCLLAYGIFQLMIIEDIPRTSEPIPLLCYYITLSMAYICLAMLGEGVVFVCVRKGTDTRHKQYVSDGVYAVACKMGRLLRVRKPRELILKDENIEVREEIMSKYAKVDHLSFESVLDAMKREQREQEDAQQKRDSYDEELHRQHRWDFVAEVVDRYVLFTYIFCIFCTPIFMFIIVPRHFASSKA